MTAKTKFILIFFITLFWASMASAQFFKPIKRINKDNYFLVDHAVFQDDANEKGKLARLEVYYQIFNPILNFNEIENAFEAEYEIKIDLYKNKKKYDSYTQSKVVRVKNKSKVDSKSDYRINQVSFFVDDGKYEVILTLLDPFHSKSIVKKFKVKIKKYKNKKPIISDIELVQAIAPIAEKSSVFDKGKLQLIPSVRHKFGMTGNATIYFYMELYQGSEKFKDVRVETVLRHKSKGMLYRDSLSSTFENPIIRQFREISIADLRPGKYELIVTLRGNRNKKLTKEIKEFEIAWTPQALIRFDYKTLIKQIELVASMDEVKALKGKETYEDKIIAFNAYWETQDPTPGTFENEVKNEFYRRIAVANHNFSYLIGDGWKSDRGNIYIRYGEPDQVDDFPLVANKNPYQEWHYYHYSKYLKFIFVDAKEDGEYRLVYPYNGLFQRFDN